MNEFEKEVISWLRVIFFFLAGGIGVLMAIFFQLRK
jgi:hypothetical protein